MKFDSEWLLSLLDGAPAPDAVAEALTDCGLLVELREPGDGAEIWDVEVTTNRPDAMNHRGLALEAAVATGSERKPLRVELSEPGPACDELAAVTIADPEVCTRFAARVVRGVRQVPSPEWLQRRLANCGVRPINAVVDVTNYVLLETGQPLHAYDLATVRGAKLVARRATAGEILKTLDGETRRLDSEIAVIADAEGVVGLAGIMGGADTEIGEQTVDVLLEAAHFNAASIRRGARRLGMHTEASHRFERGADPEMPPVAVDLAAAMMAELAAGEVCRGRIDVYPRPRQRSSIDLSITALQAFAGLEIPPERVIEILAGLEFEPARDGDTVRVIVPSHRVDIELVQDLYEEVVRHVGFAAIPARLPVLPSKPGVRDANWTLVDRARSAAVDANLYEIITWSFIDPEDDALVASQPLCAGEAVPITNPLAQTQGVMRRSLLPGMVAAAGLNLNQGEAVLALFEQGRVFFRTDSRPLESERLAVLLSRDAGDALADFKRLKGVVDNVIAHVGLPAVTWRPGGAPWLDEEAGAVMIAESGAVVGFAGLLAGDFTARWSLRAGVAVAELDLDAAREPALVRFQPLPRHPAVVMDMTVEHDIQLTYAALAAAVGELAGERVERVSFVTRFVPPDGGGRVRTTLRLVYRHPERSLTQDEVNELHEALREGVARRLDISFA